MARIAKHIIFVVDDKLQVCQIICESLEASGFEATSFSDPIQCLERISSEHCDLLIADLRMPKIDGIELMRQAKRLIPWLPVLIITGYGDVPTAVQATQAGAVDFIEKPVSKEDLLMKVKSMLSQDGQLPNRLTKGEVRVLRLVAQGKSNHEIAHLLNRTTRTVELHRSHAMQKLGLCDFTDLLKRIGGTGVAEYLAQAGQIQADDNAGSKS